MTVLCESTPQAGRHQAKTKRRPAAHDDRRRARTRSPSALALGSHRPILPPACRPKRVGTAAPRRPSPTPDSVLWEASVCFPAGPFRANLSPGYLVDARASERGRSGERCEATSAGEARREAESTSSMSAARRRSDARAAGDASGSSDARRRPVRTAARCCARPRSDGARQQRALRAAKMPRRP